MSIDELAHEARALSVAERILLVEDIWDSIAEQPDPIPVTQEQLQEVRRRLKDYHDNPETGAPWEEVRGRVFRTS